MENISLDYVVKVHLVVLYQIVDAYRRREENSVRVIGTLMGSIDKGVIEVTNSFAVPYLEHEDEVEADIGYASEVNELTKRVHPNESIVGWWATGNEVTSQSSIIHEFYSRECNNPVHLLLDTMLTDFRMAVKGFICTLIGVTKGKMGSMFTQIEVEIVSYAPENVAFNFCMQSANAAAASSGSQAGTTTTAASSGHVKQIADSAKIAISNRKLMQEMDKVLGYVDDVLAGRRKANSAIGRSLLDLINSVPNMSHEQFSEKFNNNVKDLLMITTLLQMLQTQLQLNEKLTMLTSQ